MDRAGTIGAHCLSLEAQGLQHAVESIDEGADTGLVAAVVGPLPAPRGDQEPGALQDRQVHRHGRGRGARLALQQPHAHPEFRGLPATFGKARRRIPQPLQNPQPSVAGQRLTAVEHHTTFRYFANKRTYAPAYSPGTMTQVTRRSSCSRTVRAVRVQQNAATRGYV